MKRKQETEMMESGDFGNETESVPEQSKPPIPKKLKTTNMDREFSVKEISKLKKMETLFHSSLFRMQVSELLKSVSVKQKMKSRIESAVHYLSEKLINLPKGSQVKISDRSWIESKKIQVPVIEIPKDVKGVFQFVPPSEVRLIGSVSLGTVVKPQVEIDLALLTPEDFLQSKDSMNQRYIRKKALYLTAVASHLSKLKKVESLNYAYHMGNPLRPILIVTVKGEDAKAVHVKLHVVPESHPFKVSRFHIAKNNVRPQFFFKDKAQTSDAGEESEDVNSLPATKYYNTSILQDLCMVANEDRIKEILSGAEKLRHGIMLLKIWLRQRELSWGHGMFSSFLITAFVAFLTKTKKLNKMMSSYQIFKTALLSLSKADWQSEPPSLCDEDLKENMPSMDDHKDASDCVFIDCTGSYNLACMLSDTVFKRVKEECKASLDLLDQAEETLFDALFMTPVPFARKFDHIFHIRVDNGFLEEAYDKNPNMTNSELDLGVRCRTLDVERRILSVLGKAFGKRAVVLQARPVPNTKWHVSCKPFEYDRRSFLTFGLVLDPLEAYNVLNKGPPADAAEALPFRAFWGNKSEMRRFKDGTIHEAVLWTTSTNQSDRRIICKSIVNHILKKHCGIMERDIIYRADPLDPLLEVCPRSTTKIQNYGTGEEYSLAVLKVFEQINRIVRSVSGLPLSITSIQGVHPVFRHAQVFSPLPAGFRKNKNETVTHGHQVPGHQDQLPPHVPVLTVVCGLEGSGKWPNDTDALKCMKLLLHVKLGQELKEKHTLCVGIHPTHVDVFKDGFVFRLMLACSKEITVLRTVVTESGMLQFNDTAESMALERDTVALPLHSHLIHSVQQQHPVFSATVRLCKRWLASQMIWDQVREEAIELMVASVFINPHPYSAPASPTVGLMRFFNLFSTFNWKDDILMVNLNSEFAGQDYSVTPQTFKNNRSALPAMCIATPQDKKGSVWTNEKPDQFILDRLAILAAASLKKLESQVMSVATDCDFKQIFRPVLEHFDVTIKLQPRFNAVDYQGVDANGNVFVRPLSQGHHTSKMLMPVVDFDIYLKFLHNLQEIYGSMAFFFYDRYGGNVIGLVWKSQALEKKEFKISNFVMRRPIDTEDNVSLDVAKDLILEDIEVLGSGIIEVITNHR